MSEDQPADASQENASDPGAHTDQVTQRVDDPVDQPVESADPKNLYQRIVLAALIRLGANPARPDDREGRWPTTRQQFLWDLVPEAIAAAKDGIVPPEWTTPSWAADIPDDDVPDQLAIIMEYRAQSEELVRNVELKASRLAPTLVAMLAATIALVAFEISRIGSDPSLARVVLAAGGISSGVVAAWYLVKGLSRAVDSDTRMGISQGSTPRQRVSNVRDALNAEVNGYYLANWTRKMKVRRLLDARVAVSRSLVLLTVSAVCGLVLAIIAATSPPDGEDRPRTPSGIHDDRHPGDRPNRPPGRIGR